MLGMEQINEIINLNPKILTSRCNLSFSHTLFRKPIRPRYQDAIGHTLNHAEREDLQRYLEKLATALQASVVRTALQQEQFGVLHTINDEAKVRGITKSHVLGKAMSISYEDLEAARMKRKSCAQANCMIFMSFPDSSNDLSLALHSFISLLTSLVHAQTAHLAFACPITHAPHGRFLSLRVYDALVARR